MGYIFTQQILNLKDLFVGQLRPRNSFALALILSPIIGLRLTISPLAVFFIIALVIIDTVERKTGRSLAHVSQKVIEYLPSFADGNPATAVIFIILFVFVPTP